LIPCAVTAVDLRQTVQVDEDLQIRAYYAGHVRLVSFISEAIFSFLKKSMASDVLMKFFTVKVIF